PRSPGRAARTRRGSARSRRGRSRGAVGASRSGSSSSLPALHVVYGTAIPKKPYWRAGELKVRGKGGARARPPLPADVREALAGYLRHHRAPCTTRRLFVLSKAPYRGFAHSTSLSTIVRRAINRAGLNAPFKGAHVLRHSLATGMLRSGASLDEIGEVLRHR